MFAPRPCTCARALRGGRPRPRLLSLTPLRWKTQMTQDMLHAATPLAAQLDATGLWNYGRWAKATAAPATAKGKKKAKPKGDRNRVNIVSEGLCDDALDALDLDRHHGCDLLDIYPGAGLWSRKLHEKLRPRSHLLLEPDAALYRPFLGDLLDKPGVSLIPKSGIVWKDLSSVLDAEHLPHQREVPKEEPPQRNDTLLVTANLAFYPRRRFGVFDSLSQLVLFQFISSIRAASLFHRYGLVRMLVWVEASDRHGLLARSLQRRRRLAVDGELATAWLAEVAGPDEGSGWYVRDGQLDRVVVKRVAANMKAKGIVVPPGRQTQALKDLAAADDANADTPNTSAFARPYLDELQRLEVAMAAGHITPKSADHRRLRSLTYRASREARVSDALQALLAERDALAAVKRKSTKTYQKREAKWNAAVDALPPNARQDLLLRRDNRHLVLQDPPVLAWDRREREPLVVRGDEFFPNAPCALLDVQPKAMHPLLRAMGPGTSRAGDVFELLLRGMLAQGGEPVSRAIETVWPGAGVILEQCPSLRDGPAGGIGGVYGELPARVLNEQQWTEILGAWMAWPFRPTLGQMVGRIGDEGEDVEEDGLGGGAAGALD